MASTLNLTTLQQTLTLNTSQFDSAMSKAKSDSDGLKSKLSGVGSFLAGGFVTAVTAATTAIVGLGGYAVSVGQEFESSMSQVAATMGMTVEEINNGSEAYEKLKTAAIEAGSTTKYSCSEAADALNYLALAGYDADKAVEVLPSVLNLAQAGALDLARASDMVTDAMSALNIEATSQNVTHFGDQLAKTASKSNTSVSQLGEAILTVGGTANYLAGGTNELNTALGIMANNGIKGAEGGTHLRNVLLSLSAPTDTAADALKSIGLNCKSLQDASGNLLPLNEIMQKLNKSMEGLSSTEKANVLSKIFNKTDLTAVNALLKDCGGSWDELYKNIENCDGACANMAATMDNNLKGQIASCQSAAEAFGLAIYDKLQVPLTELVGVGTQAIRDLTTAFNEDGVDGLIEAAGNMLSGFIAQAVTYAPKLVQMGVDVIQSFVSGLIKCTPDITTGVAQLGVTLLNGFTSLLPDLLALGAELIINLALGIANAVPQIVTSINTCLVGLTTKINEYLPQILEAGGTLLASLAQGITQVLPTLLTSAISIVSSLVTYLLQNAPQILQAGVDLIFSLANGLISNLPAIGSAALQAGQSILSTIGSVDWFALGISLIQKIGEGLVSMITNLGSMASQAANTVHNTIQTVNWRELGSTLISTIGNGILAMLSTLASTALQVGQAAFQAIKNINWLQLGKDLLTFIGNGILGALSGLLGIAKNVGSQALNTIKNISWVQLGTNIITFIKNGISGAVSSLTSAAKTVGTNALNTMKNINWVQLGKNIITFIKNGITGAVSTLTSSAKTVATNALNTMKNINWKTVGTNAISLVKSGLSGAVSTLSSTAKSVVNNALSAMKGISFYSVGSNIVSGIKNGVSGAASSLYSSLKSLASSALSAAKRALGIHSPSKVFQDEVGKYMAEGIGVGFDDEMENVNEDIEDNLQREYSVNPTLTTNIADRKALSGTSGSKGFLINMGDIIVHGNADEITLAKIKQIAQEQVNAFDEALAQFIPVPVTA